MDLEWKILDFFDRFKCGFLNILNYLFSEGFGYIGIIVLIFVIYWIVDKNKGVKIVFSVLLSLAFNSVLKAFIDRKRPFEFEGKEYLRKLNGSKLNDKATGSSFPSGHSQNASTACSSICFHYLQKRFLALRIIMIITVVLVMLSRVYLGVHFLSDVISGALIGLLVSFFLYKIQDVLEEKKIILYIISCLLLMPFLFIKFNSSEILFFDSEKKDFLKTFSLIVGFTLGNFIETKTIDFSCTNKTVFQKIIRLIIGISVVLVLYLIYGLAPEKIHTNSFFVLFIHFSISFSAVYIVPRIFTLIEKKK